MARVPTVTFYRGTARLIVNDTEEGRTRAAAQGFTATEPSGAPAPVAADVAPSPAEAVAGPEGDAAPGDDVGDPAPFGEAERPDFAAMSVVELRAYARENGIPLAAGVTTKAQIIEALAAAD